jgi:hypothetical protein
MEDKELLEEIRTETGKDKEMQETIKKLRAGERMDNRVALGLCEEKEGILTYEGLIWVPQNDKLRLRLLHDHHDALVAGYPGWARTLELLARKYYWPQQRQYVHRYVDNCDTCKRIKPKWHAPFGLLKPLQFYFFLFLFISYSLATVRLWRMLLITVQCWVLGPCLRTPLGYVPRAVFLFWVVAPFLSHLDVCLPASFGP